MIAPAAAAPKVKVSFVGCGSKYSIVAITAEAKTNLAMLLQGAITLTDLRAIAYKARNIANRAVMVIIAT
jgi:hypothetical protein